MATLYPKQVEINEANINKLRDTLKSSYKQIVQEMKTATDFGVKERKAILAQIEAILESTGEDVAKFIEKELPTYYKQGATQATQQLGNVGADISVKTGFNRVHKETIMAMIDDTTTAFGESLTGIKRSANNLLGKATRDMLTQEMAKGVTAGDALRNVKNAMLQRLEDEGLSALIDKSGKTWSLDAYTEMLFRTKAVEARNRGLVNRVAENGYDLVQVSSHQGTCDACARWEGSILSVSGETDGYDTVSDAEADGLFHPNCRHAINILIPKLANMSEAYNEDEDTKTLPEDVQKPNKAQTFTVFRGEGNKENPARGFDSYGKGKYYSLDKKYAEYFGAVKESEIVLRNPLEIRSQDGLSKATARMVEKGFQDMGEWAKSEGYDGIIDYETGIILKPKN